MKIKLQFFAQLRDLAKTSETVLEVPVGTTIRDLAEIIAGQHPELASHLKTVSYAMDNEYTPANTEIKSDSTIALIPPISGG